LTETDRDERAFSLMDDAATISAITRRVPAERLRMIAFADWSWLDVIGHVADTAELFAERLRRIVEENEPALLSLDTDGWVAERRTSRDPIECARTIKEQHLRIVQFLDIPGALTRTGVHSVHGRVDGGWIADYQARHSHEHTLELAKAFPPA